ncbi:unnamed protein product [Oppiella nova]|uniref:Protein kinase domain-containing protein n=1 Tax=Oppiella nova TaxID=334625 RepID=A0A7R9QLC9_9ACAR|nr:unnamed protein product [Oppiella nova]CAG2168288.1 unnamed protein product [Oppiella nova]
MPNGRSAYWPIDLSFDTAVARLVGVEATQAGTTRAISTDWILDYLNHNILFVTTDDMVWGHNMWGQLGRDVTPKGAYLKAERISYFDEKDVQQISCGFQHSLALTSNGQVYGWGRNIKGQIGCGDKQNDNFDEKEVQNLVNVRSEYVVRYYHSWTEPDFGYIQMELCSQSLRNILEVKHTILECVQYLHGLDPQMIHRDLKPDNILIAHNVRNGRFVKLCDFGLATVHDKRIHYRTTRKHTADIGDMRYMAPEIGQGEKYGLKIGIIGRDVVKCCRIIRSGLSIEIFSRIARNLTKH